MPVGSWGPGDSPLLGGLFGVFQSAAGARQSTADIWQQLRVNAATWQWQQQGGGQLPPIEQLERTGRQILRDQGVGIQQVNTYRAIANQWRTAESNLHRQAEDDQILATSIFQPPWAQTAASGVPERYRIRVQWQLGDSEGNLTEQWRSYELDGPLGSVQDALAQASVAKGQNPKSDQPGAISGPFVNDFNIEQI